MTWILALDALLGLWCVLWSASEDFDWTKRWTYGVAATVFLALFALGLVQEIFHE